MFVGATLEGDAEFGGVSIEGDAEFGGATIEGVAEFGGATIEGDARFGKTTFKGDARFGKATFKGVAGFGGTAFKGNAWFHEATFKGEGIFRTTFEKDAGFVGATFKGDTGFGGATFKGDTGFGGATFEGSARFDGATFKGYAGFKGLTLFKKFSLQKINVQNNFYLEVENWSSTTNNEESIYLIQLWGPIIEGKGKIIVTGSLGEIDDNLIAGLSLRNTELDRFEFIDADWIHCYGRQTVIDEYILNSEILGKSSTGGVAQIYRRLRENYEKAKRYSDAGDFYVGEMEVLRNNLGGNKYLQLKWWLYSIYFYLSKYGESVTLPLTYSLALILLFAGIRVGYTPSIPATLQGFIEALSDSFRAYIQLKSTTPLDHYQRLFSAPLLAMAAVAIKRTLDRK